MSEEFNILFRRSSTFRKQISKVFTHLYFLCKLLPDSPTSGLDRRDPVTVRDVCLSDLIRDLVGEEGIRKSVEMPAVCDWALSC